MSRGTYGLIGLALSITVLSVVGFIVRDYLRVTHRMARMEKREQRLRRMWWPKLPPCELERLRRLRRAV